MHLDKSKTCKESGQMMRSYILIQTPVNQTVKMISFHMQKAVLVKGWMAEYILLLARRFLQNLRCDCHLERRNDIILLLYKRTNWRTS
ncbi:hypothetical protein HLI_00935 [Halobacillus litoralis]|uniref:Uncharacterized protein n=1 Tax=Halobacillus litoralis TaxID=45668 RepID=A0A410M7F4_9BACI|nr:hypothetical protein HLI_00935 [Halobacillus litoralis]